MTSLAGVTMLIKSLLKFMYWDECYDKGYGRFEELSCKSIKKIFEKIFEIHFVIKPNNNNFLIIWPRKNFEKVTK